MWPQRLQEGPSGSAVSNENIAKLAALQLEMAVMRNRLEEDAARLAALKAIADDLLLDLAPPTPSTPILRTLPPKKD